ncbi:MAG: hypothetical protein UR28_C0010G0058 [Candidatus Peregrinibacteria bacterium GW2011_GWF2_33_10]|nr:MAG: hypothetical protein UR28_C0010G0058 [Candidatus Peregrinibacteria bacterium GW2011_GWF2_33_10]OGJ46094.1 MAG: hypothetical protein A2272_05205 [Candidatus Peregrinibacteria bacterium RIFOXYA12_FULL_33_12]OGJ46201.1 MAG: hypothetical protein A2263_04920 [Candidatus Peregrinibacteria bacterium RIFOXYA2_FULL_33_21]OGJ51617.1 MAG: hypothetical protein A2307_04090 [Candidatus Peregrinibacteria bacterium RIFOXYB2_FULL_33_20]
MELDNQSIKIVLTQIPETGIMTKYSPTKEDLRSGEAIEQEITKILNRIRQTIFSAYSKQCKAKEAKDSTELNSILKALGLYQEILKFRNTLSGLLNISCLKPLKEKEISKLRNDVNQYLTRIYELLDANESTENNSDRLMQRLEREISCTFPDFRIKVALQDILKQAPRNISQILVLYLGLKYVGDFSDTNAVLFAIIILEVLSVTTSLKKHQNPKI